MRGDGSRLTSSGLSLCGVFMVWSGKRQERCDRGRGEDHGQGIGEKTNDNMIYPCTSLSSVPWLMGVQVLDFFFTGAGHMLGSGFANIHGLKIFNYVF